MTIPQAKKENEEVKSVEEIVKLNRTCGCSLGWCKECLKWKGVVETALTHLTTQIRKEAVEEERERMQAVVKGVRDALEISLHNAVSDQRAPYRHAVKAIDEEILQTLTNPNNTKER